MLFVKELLDVPDVLLQSRRRDLVHQLGHVAQKVAVVGHHHQRAIEGLKRLLEHGLALQIQVVGRLVQDQDVVRVEEQFAQGQPCLLSARQHLDLLVHVFS